MKGLFLAVVLALATAPVSAFTIQQPEQNPKTEFVVIGLVARPGVYTWRANLTVREAISESGGRVRRADPVAVFFRVPPDRQPVPAQLDDLVKQGDVLFVPPAQQNTSTPASGLWHLLSADVSEEPLPQHRVDIRLYMSPAPMRAAMVNRQTNEDLRPFSLAEFDGETLRLGQRSEVPGSEGKLVVLQMRWDGARFFGLYVDENGDPVPGAVSLKLVRAAQ